MPLRFGYPTEEWERGRDEIRQVLIGRARQGNDGADISYGERCRRLTSISPEPHGQPLAYLLGKISEAEDKENRPLLSVLVVLQDTYRPGAGFFNLAETLGHRCPDRDACWIQERGR